MQIIKDEILNIEQKFEYINKLIFIKEYHKAYELLFELLKDETAKTNILIHLRLIELSAKINKLAQLKKFYNTKFTTPNLEFLKDICLIFIEYLNGKTSIEKVIELFQNYITKYGENAAAYFGIGSCWETIGNIKRAIYNYEKSITLDPQFDPSYFGLSQCYYQLNQNKIANQYFYMFEKMAPYNVYGNIITHTKLAEEFLNAGMLKEAKKAISTLSEWWMENQGYCPLEVQIAQIFLEIKIYEKERNPVLLNQANEHLNILFEQALESKQLKEDSLFYLATLFEKYDQKQRALILYKKIIQLAATNTKLIQKIGAHLLSEEDYELCLTLFKEAYEIYPDNPDIRFCLLLSKLKLSNVNVEEYLIGKERLQYLLINNSDPVELLSLLHNLYARFKEDPDVHAQMGDMYLKLNNLDKASFHIKKMYELDPKGTTSLIKYCSYLLQYEKEEDALPILNQLKLKSNLQKHELLSINALNAIYYYKKRIFDKAQKYTQQVLQEDPWNVSYIALNILCLLELSNLDVDLKTPDNIIISLYQGIEYNLNWNGFEEKTEEFEKLHYFEIAYLRRKLLYLYSGASQPSLEKLIETAKKYDPQKAMHDFIKVLNTNFDSADIYIALGLLSKELWQLETAIMWFEQVLMSTDAKEYHKSISYLEIADCYIWSNKNYNKALEYTKIALEINPALGTKGLITLAHAFLKTGKIKEATLYLEKLNEPSFELIYLKGLLEYRNGSYNKAHKIWKPLISQKTLDLKSYYIKKQMLEYYFENKSYLQKVN